MWEVTYSLSPKRGYFDAGEPALLDAGIRLVSIHGIEFVSDGSVVIVYEVEGPVESISAFLDAGERVLDYEITRDDDVTVAQIRFVPDETLERIFSIQQSFGVSMQFPLEYVSSAPATLEITEIGPREELRSRIWETREVATVEVLQLTPYEPNANHLFRELTERQQEVLLTAIELGYYRNPREATQADVANELACSTSTVGQHLRRIEARIVSAVAPDECAAPSSRARMR